MQDEVGAEPLEQSLKLHVLQVGVHGPRELDQLPRETHQTPSEEVERSPHAVFPKKVIWEQLTTQSLQRMHRVPLQGTNLI